jgi:hypothetical protein
MVHHINPAASSEALIRRITDSHSGLVRRRATELYDLIIVDSDRMVCVGHAKAAAVIA